MTTKTWTAEVAIDETPERTDVRVTLHTDAGDRVAEGHARRNPHDPNVPQIGEELATARALAVLSHRLMEESADILEGALGHEVRLGS